MSIDPTTLSPAKQAFIAAATEHNPLERVLAFVEKMEAGLTMEGTGDNPRYAAASFELCITDGSGAISILDPMPYRYDDNEAGARHMLTGRVQPECVPYHVIVWSDGSTSEVLWDRDWWGESATMEPANVSAKARRPAAARR